MARALHRSALSLIPLYGEKDSSRPKEAAVSLTQYQTAPATWPQVIQWVTSGYQLGIATGRVSGVVVIDFNNFQLWQDFRASELPSLIGKRLTVRTPNGIHLYIPVTTNGPLIVPQRAPRWTLRGCGDVVVAPHSIIRGRGYQIVAGSVEDMGTPSEAAVIALLAWFAEQEGFVSAQFATDENG